MISIPPNTERCEDPFEKLAAEVVACLKESPFTTLSWRNTDRATARRVADAFIKKGYHASEYITRDLGWSFTTIAKHPLKGDEAAMSYETVIG